MKIETAIRPMTNADPPRIAALLRDIGWNKPQATFERYVKEQAAGACLAFVAEANREIAGYVTLVWQPSYAYFRERGVPEIKDLNVLPKFRRRGIATKLVAHAEKQASTVGRQVGIGVGLHPGYNAAQRMYALRGYVPDGRGVAYDNRYVGEGERATFDDHLVLHLIKQR